ncbi:MAG: NAD-dependent malic enzyme [Opitutaceae bacterium]|nr:NAD-dependent malic enzyme [Opitutaceae bacterium]
MKRTLGGGLLPHAGPMLPRGTAILANPLLNKGTAFTERERDALGLRGLLPPRVFPIEEQVKRAIGNFRRKTDPLDKYTFLSGLQGRNETLFYRLLEEYPEEMIPIIYTPTVGQACLEFGAIYRRQRGLYITSKDKGRISEILGNWPNPDVRMIVVTDGERILGLGDLGAYGMGIPIGKLGLYTSCAGVHPYYCLPITIDVGTNNKKLHDDPMYIGLAQERVRGAEYDELIEEFVTAVQKAYPKVLIQWEDFGNTTAFHILHKYQKRVLSFNDDIQGTASVALAGILGGLSLNGGKLTEQKLLFLGAGEAGTGIADLFVEAAVQAGMDADAARKRCWFVDSQGLVVKDRPGKLAEHKVPYAQDHAFVATLGEAVEVLKPTILIGVSGTPKTFTKEIVTRMAALNAQPIIFALSNPTSKAECTAEEAYTWTDGRAIFASGSPFPACTLNGKTYVPGQGNNVYIFPGVGLGALACESREVTNKMFLIAAQTLASLVGPEDFAVRRVYPPLSKIREVSAKIAAAVVEECHREGLAQLPRPADIEADVRARMFQPTYEEYI